MRKEETTRLLIKADALDARYVEPTEIKKYSPEQLIEIDGYAYVVEDKTDDEITTTLLAKQTIYLKTIRNIIIFFFVMWLIGTVISTAYIFKIISSLGG